MALFLIKFDLIFKYKYIIIVRNESRNRTNKDAASQVKTKRNTRIDDAGVAGQILESQVQKMTTQQYEARSDEIMEAIRSGKFIYDISGGAR